MSICLWDVRGREPLRTDGLCSPRTRLHPSLVLGRGACDWWGVILAYAPALYSAASSLQRMGNAAPPIALQNHPSVATTMTFLFNPKPAVFSAPAAAPLQSFVSRPARMEGTTHLPNEQSLAQQILHNLQYQHYWTDLQVHTLSPVTNAPLPRPLVSGLPPQRLYVHPDEQVELLKKADVRKKAGESNILDVKAAAEREWILPTRLNEKWTLHRLADIFDAISLIPLAPGASPAEEVRPTNPWRTTKRVLLSTVDSDSTVVYYIVHDGVVKPRQN